MSEKSEDQIIADFLDGEIKSAMLRMDSICPHCGKEIWQDNTPKPSPVEDDLESEIYVHLNTHGYNLMSIQSRKDLASAVRKYYWRFRIL